MTTTQLAAQQITPARPGHSRRTATPVIAFLGTGRMGGPMAANLARAGFRVRAWDRTASHAAALIKDGATPRAARPKPSRAPRSSSHAGRRARHRTGIARAGRELDIAPGLIWVQMATVGMEWTRAFRQHRHPVPG